MTKTPLKVFNYLQIIRLAPIGYPVIRNYTPESSIDRIYCDHLN